jgi:hypothetical protein
MVEAGLVGLFLGLEKNVILSSCFFIRLHYG